MNTAPLLLRNVERDGEQTNLRVENGCIALIGNVEARGAHEIDARGGALLPGLIDHHIHLYATAARRASLDASHLATRDELVIALRGASEKRGQGQWIRAIGFDDTRLGLLSRADLDAVPNPVRLQDRTGALWVLNSAALDLVLQHSTPTCVERDANGVPTGRIWRGDAWLRTRIQSTPPSLADLSNALAAWGVTGVTDASVTNDPEQAALFTHAKETGELKQKLCLMSGDYIPRSERYEIGPLKILPDERDLPEVEHIAARMRRARELKRNIAVHCVTAAELAIALAAFEQIGAQASDRLEHGGIIPEAMFEDIKALRLTVVTQPNFIRDRGDRYAQTIAAEELPDLYRLASLKRAGVKLAAGSDAPYGDPNPWSAIAAGTTRQTKSGQILGEKEKLSARDALSLYLGAFHAPAGPVRKIEIGAPADLCILKTPLQDALNAPDKVEVAATIANGDIIYADDAIA